MAQRPIGVKTTLLAAAALLALTLSSCGDEDPTTMADDAPAAAVSLDDLDGRTFASVRVDGHQLIDDTRIRLGFKGEELSADAGCNHLFGTLAVDGETLTASDMGGTEMGCPDGRNDQDAWVAEFLGSGPTAVLDGDTLTLTRDDVEIELVELDVPDAPTGDPDQPTSN